MTENISSELRLDSHKMNYHPAEVAKWLEGELTWPINIEIGLSGACNHRCCFCAFEYLEYIPTFLDKDILLQNLKALKKRGLKSILFAGFGEPLLHKEAADIIHLSKMLDIDVALSTNGVMFTRLTRDKCLGDLSWMRFSIASPVAKTYSYIHRCGVEDYKKVIANIEETAREKQDNGFSTTIGMQMLVLPDNVKEIPQMAKLGRELGADYVSIKPFNQGHKRIANKKVDEGLLLQVYDEAKSYESSTFKVYIRKNLILQHKLNKPNYNECGMLDFFCIINADGTVIPCTVFPGNDDFVYGNINYDTFENIWMSDKRLSVKERINGEEFEKYCYSDDCKMRMQNEYLFRLKHPHPHVNFV